MNWKTVMLLLIGLLAGSIFACSHSSQQGVITLDPKTTYQTITGWEATTQAGQGDEYDSRASPGPYVNASKPFQLYKDRLFDLAVNDLGINRVRLECKCSMENSVDYVDLYMRGQITWDEWTRHRVEMINDDTDPFHINPNGFQFTALDYQIEHVVLPIKERVEANNEKLFINTTYVCFKATSSLHRSNPEEYAEFVLAAYQHMQSKYGFVPDSWEVILEPDTNTGWTATQMGQAVAAAGRRLEANGFTPHFVVPSTTNAANAPVWFDQIVAVPGALPYISEISYHRYHGVSDRVLQQIGERAVKYHISAAMLEFIGASYEDLHQDLKLARNSSWSEFVLAYPHTNDDGGKYYMVDQRNADNPVVIMGSRTKFLRQYFKFIRRGAVRIDALSNNDRFDPLAFINANGNYVVVIKADAGGSFVVRGLPSGTYGIKFTTSSQYDVDEPDVTIAAGQALDASIPRPGVITVYTKSSAIEQRRRASSNN
jgi:hypothetical protein